MSAPKLRELVSGNTQVLHALRHATPSPVQKLQTTSIQSLVFCKEDDAHILQSNTLMTEGARSNSLFIHHYSIMPSSAGGSLVNMCNKVIPYVNLCWGGGLLLSYTIYGYTQTSDLIWSADVSIGCDFRGSQQKGQVASTRSDNTAALHSPATLANTDTGAQSSA